MGEFVSHIEAINQGLAEQREKGIVSELDFRGKPDLHILETDPLAYERYGTFRNKAPIIAGKLTVDALLAATSSEEARSGGIYLMSQVGSEFYGIRLNDPEVLNSIARCAGREDLATFQSINGS